MPIFDEIRTTCHFFYRFAPVIAALTTLKIVLQTREIRQHARIIPYIYLQKLSCCKGAVKKPEALKQGEG